MSDWEYGLMVLVSLAVVVDPVAIVPVFLAMTPGDGRVERLRMAKEACLVATGVLIFFALLGNVLLRFLGIEMPAFQIAGGILLFAIAFDMLQGRDSPRRITPEENEAGARKPDIAVSPLAVPLLSGPGAISATMLLESQAENWLRLGFLYGAIVVVMLASYYVLRLSVSGAQWLSPIALRLVQRLSGLVLAALAAQFVINGMAALGVVRAG